MNATPKRREGGLGARVYIVVDSYKNGYQSIKICAVEFQDAGTYVAKVKTAHSGVRPDITCALNRLTQTQCQINIF